MFKDARVLFNFVMQKIQQNTMPQHSNAGKVSCISFK